MDQEQEHATAGCVDRPLEIRHAGDRLMVGFDDRAAALEAGLRCRAVRC